MRKVTRFGAAMLTILGGIGFLFKIIVWILNAIGIGQTAVETWPVIKILVGIPQFWPSAMFLAGVFILACMKWGSPLVWFQPKARAKTDSDLRVSALGSDWNWKNGELSVHLQFRNNGAKQRTILSVIFGYRDPDRTHENMWEYLTPVHGLLGNVEPLRLEPDSEETPTYKVSVAHRFLEKAGGVIGFIIKASSPMGKMTDRGFEYLTITTPAGNNDNRIGYTGRRIENVSLDRDET